MRGKWSAVTYNTRVGVEVKMYNSVWKLRWDKWDMQTPYSFPGLKMGIKKKFINLFKPKHLAFILIMSYFKNDIICTNFMITISWKYSYIHDIVIVVFMQKKKIIIKQFNPLKLLLIFFTRNFSYIFFISDISGMKAYVYIIWVFLWRPFRWSALPGWHHGSYRSLKNLCGGKECA